MLKVREWFNKFKKKQFDVIFNENGDRYALVINTGKTVKRFTRYAAIYKTESIYIEIISFREDRIRIQFKVFDRDRNYVCTEVAAMNEVNIIYQDITIPSKSDNHA